MAAESSGPTLHIRAGDPRDEATLLRLWDRAISWLVARGQAQQWGSEPASAHPRTRALVREWVEGSGLRMAEIGEVPVGASVIVDSPPPHIPRIPQRETYLLFLISDRDQAGRGIGAALVRQAVDEARAAGSQRLRVDCWAGAPALIAFYERQGFVRSDTFTVDVRGAWHGQVFEMVL